MQQTNIRYGLTCLSEILSRQSKTYRYRTITRKRFNELGRTHGLSQLSERILHNVNYAKVILMHCAEQDITHYRIPEFFPLLTDDSLSLTFTDLPDHATIIKEIVELGKLASTLGVRIGAHPDQFVILCSPRDTVCAKSIVELNQLSWFFNQMQLPQSYVAPINIHPSCALNDTQSMEVVAHRFYTNLMKCDLGVRNRLVLENEDKSSWNCENLLAFHKLLDTEYGFKIPLTWDNWHHKCNPSSALISDNYWLQKFKETWPVEVEPVMHWSEGGKNGKLRAHVDYISETVGKPFDSTCIWELEVKAKDNAILKLQSK